MGLDGIVKEEPGLLNCDYVPKEGTSNADEELKVESNQVAYDEVCPGYPKHEDDWRAITIFHTNIKYGDKCSKFIINGGSCINVISETAVERLKLKPEPHPQPYRFAWVGKTSMAVSRGCLVSSPGVWDNG